MLRTVLGAIAGFVLIGILVIFTDQLFSVLARGFDSAASPPAAYFVVSLFTDTFYSFIGGYLCASIAAKNARQATLGMIGGGEILGLAAMILTWRTAPHWFPLGLLIFYPPAVWLGSRLRARGLTAAL